MSSTTGNFLIPTWDRSSFEEDYRNAKGIEREWVKIGARATKIVQPLKEAPIAGPTVGWYALWSKYVHLPRAARSVAEIDSAYLLELLDRPLLELFLHVSTIGNPRWRGGDPESYDFGATPADETPEDIRDRLSAYCAWCLDQDVRLIESGLDPETLESLFDYRWQRHFARWVSAHSEGWEREFGEIEVVGDAEAKLDRERFEKAMRERKHHAESLLDDLRLRGWIDRIRERKKKSSIAFPDLFATSERQNMKGVKGKLDSMGMPWAYWRYGARSMLLHQSSLLQFVHTSERGVSVRIPQEFDLQERALQTARLIKLGLVLMEAVWKRGYPDQPTRSVSTSAGP